MYKFTLLGYRVSQPLWTDTARMTDAIIDRTVHFVPFPQIFDRLTERGAYPCLRISTYLPRICVVLPFIAFGE